MPSPSSAGALPPPPPPGPAAVIPAAAAAPGLRTDSEARMSPMRAATPGTCRPMRYVSPSTWPPRPRRALMRLRVPGTPVRLSSLQKRLAPRGPASAMALAAARQAIASCGGRVFQAGARSLIPGGGRGSGRPSRSLEGNRLRPRHGPHLDAERRRQVLLAAVGKARDHRAPRVDHHLHQVPLPPALAAPLLLGRCRCAGAALARWGSTGGEERSEGGLDVGREQGEHDRHVRIFPIFPIFPIGRRYRCCCCCRRCLGWPRRPRLGGLPQEGREGHAGQVLGGLDRQLQVAPGGQLPRGAVRPLYRPGAVRVGKVPLAVGQTQLQDRRRPRRAQVPLLRRAQRRQLHHLGIWAREGGAGGEEEKKRLRTQPSLSPLNVCSVQRAGP